MFGVIMGISNNYARRANYNTDSEENLKTVSRSTFCYHENFSPKKSKKLPKQDNKENHHIKEKTDILAFSQDIKRACKIYNYSSDDADRVQKSNRKLAISRIEEMVNDNECLIKFFIPQFENVMEMITKNIFLNLNTNFNNNSADDISIADTTIDTKNMFIDKDPAWPHMQGIFNIFYKLVVNSYFVLKLQTYIYKDFIKNILSLLDSDIEEKRQILKNILHKIYANMVSKRKMIRKVSTRFLKYNNFCGTGEILDFFASIIKGFVTPLNEEKLTFFIDILLPLHKTNCEQYYDKLVKCCINYVEKDETLAIPMIEVILVFYPCSNELKKKLFINELVDLLTIVKIEKYLSFLKKIIPYLLELITKGLSSEALFPYIVKLFSVESFLRIIDHYKKEIFSLVVPIIDSLELDLTKGITLLSQTSIDSVTNQNEWLEKGILIDHIQTIKIRLKYIDEELYLKYTKI